MGIKSYTGNPGAGKSHEVVKNVICPAIKSGRRVITNIAGVDFEKIKLYLGSPISDSFGELVFVSEDTVKNPQFWLCDTDDVYSRDTDQIQPGDLLVLDEIWRFWSGFDKCPERVLNFFRMHRHFVHPVTGITCDAVLVTQNVMDVAAKIRRVIDENYVMQKMTAVGAAKRYKIEIYKGGSFEYFDKIRTMFEKLDPAVFPLYKSHSKGESAGVEVNPDNRGNIFRSPKIIIAACLAVLFIGWPLFTVVPKYFFGGAREEAAEKKAESEKPTVAPSHVNGNYSSPPPSNNVILGRITVRGTTYFVADSGNAFVYVEFPESVSVTPFTSTAVKNGITYSTSSVKPKNEKSSSSIGSSF